MLTSTFFCFRILQMVERLVGSENERWEFKVLGFGGSEKSGLSLITVDFKDKEGDIDNLKGKPFIEVLNFFGARGWQFRGDILDELGAYILLQRTIPDNK